MEQYYVFLAIFGLHIKNLLNFSAQDQQNGHILSTSGSYEFSFFMSQKFGIISSRDYQPEILQAFILQRLFLR
jgi:hypothetical protein